MANADLIIPNHFTTQFDTNWKELAQQKVSRLRNLCSVETGCTGERITHNQTGAIESEETTGQRYKETTIRDLPTAMRNIFPREFQSVTGESRWDESGLLPTVAPRGKHTSAHASAFGRRCDRLIIEALGGVAITGPGGTQGFTNVSLPTSSKVAKDWVPSGTAADSNLTVSKLIHGLGLLETSEAYGQDQMDTGVTVAVACSAAMLEALRIDAASPTGSRLWSKDFMPPVLDERGQIKSFLGAEFVRTELLPRDTTDSNIQYGYLFTSDAIQLDIWEEMTTTIDRLPEKSNAIQFLSQYRLAAGRLDEVRVIQIACKVA